MPRPGPGRALETGRRGPCPHPECLHRQRPRSSVPNLSRPCLSAGIGNLPKSPSSFPTLRCLLQLLGFFSECFRGFRCNTNVSPVTCVFLSHIYSAWPGVSERSLETRELDVPGLSRAEQPRTHHDTEGAEASLVHAETSGRLLCEGPCEKAVSQAHTDPRRRRGGERAASDLQGTPGLRTQPRSSEAENTGQRQRVFHKAKYIPFEGHPLVIHSEMK